MRISNESYVVDKVRCPKCAERGADTRSDNLAVYSDKHKYCFSCGYYEHGEMHITYEQQPPITRNKDFFNIPEDASGDLPYSVTEWLYKKCHFTMEDIINNKILWSNKLLWLIFPIETHGIMHGFQARNFNESKPYKWFTKFPKQEIFKVYSNGDLYRKSLVVVEDIISAIRVGHIHATSPAFGCKISDNYLLKCKERGWSEVIIWLDEDKYTESLQYSIRARELGLKSRIIHTKLDPKEYTNTEIKHFIGD